MAKNSAELEQEVQELAAEADRVKAGRPDRRKIRYVTLAWFDRDADPSRRHVEGNFPESDVLAILEGLLRRGVPEVNVEDRDFSLTSLEAAREAAEHARRSLDRRRS